MNFVSDIVFGYTDWFVFKCISMSECIPQNTFTHTHFFFHTRLLRLHFICHTRHSVPEYFNIVRTAYMYSKSCIQCMECSEENSNKELLTKWLWKLKCNSKFIFFFIKTPQTISKPGVFIWCMCVCMRFGKPFYIVIVRRCVIRSPKAVLFFQPEELEECNVVLWVNHVFRPTNFISNGFRHYQFVFGVFYG